MTWQDTEDFASDGFTKVEDGDSIEFIPLTEPVLESQEFERGKGKSKRMEERHVATVKVAMVESGKLTGEVLSHKMSPKWFGLYKRIMRNGKKTLERQVVVQVSRSGEGIDDTIYTYKARKPSPALLKEVKTL